MIPPLPERWAPVLADEAEAAYYGQMARRLRQERREHEVYPPAAQTFAALELTAPEATRVVILGQDPYHGPGQAHGLSFSVNAGIAMPPSLRNIFREMEADLGTPAPASGDLSAWARQGVLLLNTVLTVRAGSAGSHRGIGWEHFTSAILRQLARQRRPPVFVLWGRDAHRKKPLLGAGPVIEAPHPSPLSAYRGFFGSRPFTRVNEALTLTGHDPVDWSLSPS